MSRILIVVGAALVAAMLLFSMQNPPTQGLSRGELAGLPSAPPDGDAWFQEKVTDNPRLVLVDFSAVWCGPCRMMLPVLERLAKEYEGRVDLVNVDVDERPQIAGHYNASSIPLVLLMHRGTVLDGIPGFSGPEADYQTLKGMIETHLPKIAKARE